MALPNNAKIEKSFNQKRKSRFHDDNNFHVIIAPGAVQKQFWSSSVLFNPHIFSVMALAQFFGLFPVSGILKRNIRKVEFKWMSVRAFHSVFWLVSGSTFAFLEILQLSRYEHLNPKNIS